ncbi:DUF6296 family protein [Kitasatospora sp. NPDC001547]|uniref:DUF6296 family protein n=1 Tax=Kitasatospora sp. NPDC001547 TaxID=3364015 RepID=UPI00368C8303|nr:hypothetical protein KitaXyl93_01670 [Kitasatospora sp. Xyl93]
MRSLTRRYAVTLPGPIGGHAPPSVVVVHETQNLGPGGGPVWESSDGGLRVEITGGVATVLATPGSCNSRHPCLTAVPLP